jgi:hypothetical protein
MTILAIAAAIAAVTLYGIFAILFTNETMK